MIAANGRAIVSVNLSPEELGSCPRADFDGVSHRFSDRSGARRFPDRQHRLALDFFI